MLGILRKTRLRVLIISKVSSTETINREKLTNV